MPQLSLHSPVGDLTVSEEAGSIVAVDWGWGRDQTETPLLLRTRDMLQAYFDGDPTDFDLPLSPNGTVYRRAVWTALRTIPSGQTKTYGQLATLVGGSARSIGGAMASNPIPILIPCHRIVAGGYAPPGASNGRSDRSLGGFSGGDGAETKLFLLALERRAALPAPPLQTILELT